MMSFWDELPKPIIALAPMADVTDVAFRRVIAKYSKHTRKDGTEGGPDVMWTEFVAADGLVRATPEGKVKLLADLKYAEEERPIIAQLFSSKPEYMTEASRLCQELGFDGIDINMGCPHRAIEKQGCGSAMIRNPQEAKEIIRAVKRGAPTLPVTVKTRIGYNTIELDTWLPALLEEDLAVITLHARTRKEMSKVPAQWDQIAEAVRLRNEIQNDAWQTQNPDKKKTLIFGNGDIDSLSDAYLKAEESGADGVMVGRGIFGDPWFFHPDVDVLDISIEERLRVMIEHTKIFEAELPFKSFSVMKKHYKAYMHGFDGSKELREALMQTESSEEVEVVVNRFLNTEH